MLLALAMLLALVTVPLLGGRLTALGEAHFRWSWLIVCAIGLQILIVSVWPTAPEGVGDVLHFASYGCAGAWILANVRVAGIALIGLGGLLNFVAIAANGGTMPADPDAVATAGLALEPGQFQNSAPVADAKLQFLGDIFAVPEGVFFANVFSPGDILIAVGAFVLVHWLCGTVVAGRRARARVHHAAPVA